jgi:hypothetical protein
VSCSLLRRVGWRRGRVTFNLESPLLQEAVRLLPAAEFLGVKFFAIGKFIRQRNRVLGRISFPFEAKAVFAGGSVSGDAMGIDFLNR